MNIPFSRSWAAALIFAGCESGWAQHNADTDHTDFKEITVIARSLDSTALARPALQLSGAELTQRQAGTLGETLDSLPGIANSSFGPNVGRPVMRGMSGERAPILQNGGANFDLSAMSADHAVPLDPLAIDRIDILRGPSSLLYGGMAPGGLVHVRDNRIARDRVFDASGGVMGKAELRAGGASGERGAAAMVETGNDRWVLHADAFERQTRDMKIPTAMTCQLGGNTVAQSRVCNTASNARGGAVGATLMLDHGYLGLSTSEYRNDYGTAAADDVIIGMRRRQHALEGAWRDIGDVWSQMKFQAAWTPYTHTEYENGVANTRFDNAGRDMRLEAHQQVKELGQGWRLEGVTGLQHERSAVTIQGSEAYVPNTLSTQTALFALQMVKTPWGEISAGARTAAAVVNSLPSNDPSRFTLGERHFRPTSVSLGVMRNLRQAPEQGWQISAQAGQSQRAPMAHELFANGSHTATATVEVGNPAIGLEKATHFELGGEWRNGPHSFALSGFVNQFDNYLSLQNTGMFQGGEPVYRYEGVRARFVGMESTARQRLIGGQQALWSPHAAHGNLDVAWRFDVVRADDLTHDQALPRIAPMRLGADLMWARESWGARFGVLHAAAQDRVPTGDRTTGGYNLWHAALNYHTHVNGTHWMWFAKLDNLTNQLAYNATSVLRQTLATDRVPPLAGRSLRVGVQASF